MYTYLPCSKNNWEHSEILIITTGTHPKRCDHDDKTSDISIMMIKISRNSDCFLSSQSKQCKITVILHNLPYIVLKPPLISCDVANLTSVVVGRMSTHVGPIVVGPMFVATSHHCCRSHVCRNLPPLLVQRHLEHHRQCVGNVFSSLWFKRCFSRYLIFMVTSL